MRGLVATAIVLCLATAFARPAGATVVRAPSFAQLVQRADLIVIAEVTDVRVESARAREGSVPTTVVAVRVRETLKGKPRVQLVLELAGGRVKDDDLEIAGQPSFVIGEKDVLFLSEAAGAIGPVAGLFAGRLRIAEVVTGHGDAVIVANDGRALSADLSAAPKPALAGERLTLAKLRRAVLDEARAPTGSRPAASAGGLLAAGGANDEATASAPAAGCLVIDLGTSPDFADGCREWRCVAQRALASAGQDTSFRLLRPDDPLDGCGVVRRLQWAHEVYGRALDDLTLAVRVERASGAARSSTVFLNRSLEWNSFAGTPAGTTAIDAWRVLSEEFATWPGASPVAGGALSAGGKRTRDGDAAAETLRRSVGESTAWGGSGPRGLAAGGCDPASGAILNPRLLIFESPDYAMMTSYEVGFFDPGGDSPLAVVNVPLTAFYQRRTIDLPADASAGLQATLVADITAAGLSTPAGRVLTYRVRGVWKGGRTLWSVASPSFVRCPS